MQHYDVAPKAGWRKFSRNEDLSNKIFDEGFERVNASEWDYVNPATGMSIFEDKTGDYLFIETVDKGEALLITDMHCGLLDDGAEMCLWLKSLAEEFSLTLTVMPENE